MILSRLVDLIRFEAGMPGSSTATAFIEETILEVLRELTAIDLYQERLAVNNIVSAGASVQLPTDYQHLKSERVRYLPAGSFDDAYFLLESEYWDFTDNGPSSRYQLSTGFILLYPTVEIALGDQICFDYYMAVTSLNDNDPFPIPALEATVKKQVLARVKRLIGKNADADEVGAEVSLGRSKGDGTTNK